MFLEGLDALDQKIVSLLIENARMSYSDIAQRVGISRVAVKMRVQALEKRGVSEINRAGEKFDPNLENAVMQGSPEDGEPGTVCEVFQKGYQLEGTVLRHAMVKVVPE